jgi:hypothetical protein
MNRRTEARMETGNTPVTYDLDDRDRILATGGEWDRFAIANAAPELATRSVIGHPLWRFVEGEEVRHLLRLLLDQVRERNRSVSVPFRCDAPALRRFMSMSIHPLEGGVLRVESVVLRTEPRAYMPLLERSHRLLYGMLSICSWCKRVRLFNREWVEIEQCVGRLNLFGSTDLPHLSHGICLPCAERAFQIVHSHELNGAP